MTAITVRDVHKRFGRGSRAVDALSGVSLEVRPGEIYGLLGRNGAGKTTLVKILLDIVRASRGETLLLGEPTSAARARQPVGYLPEDHRFPDYQTAEGALQFYAALSGVPASVARERAPGLLELVRLGAVRRKKVRTFSKGMKQRLGLAQALIHEPQILFLDEPTDGVDPVGRAEIRDLLAELRASGKTIFLNSHLLSEVEQICDRVGILDRGQLVREGTIAELTATELVYTVRTAVPPDAAALAQAERLGTSLRVLDERSIEVGLGDEAAVDQLVELLRGFGLRQLNGKKLSLEEVFLEAVHEDGDGDGVGDGGAR